MKTVLSALLIAIPIAASADENDLAVRIEAGFNFAQRWCTGCHIVGPNTPGGTVGPAFAEIAGRPGKTADNLFNWMIAPHPPMPDLELSEIESDLLADYIMSLRK